MLGSIRFDRRIVANASVSRAGMPSAVKATDLPTSLRGAQRRSNPAAAPEDWIASSQELLAMTNLGYSAQQNIPTSRIFSLI
jgi:hypothetical protein